MLFLLFIVADLVLIGVEAHFLAEVTESVLILVDANLFIRVADLVVIRVEALPIAKVAEPVLIVINAYRLIDVANPICIDVSALGLQHFCNSLSLLEYLFRSACCRTIFVVDAAAIIDAPDSR